MTPLFVFFALSVSTCAEAAKPMVRRELHSDLTTDGSAGLSNDDESALSQESSRSLHNEGHLDAQAGTSSSLNEGNSLYLTAFYYDFPSEKAKKPFWMLKNLLHSLESSSDKIRLMILFRPENASDVSAIHRFQRGLHKWKHRVSVIDMLQIRSRLDANGVGDSYPRSTDNWEAPWKVYLARAFMSSSNLSAVMVLDLGVACNVKSATMPSFMVPARKPLGVLSYALSQMPASSGVACSRPADMGHQFKYATGFCVFRAMPRTLEFMQRLYEHLFRAGDEYLQYLFPNPDDSFNSLAEEEGSIGFVSALPRDVIQTVNDDWHGIAKGGLCYHYTPWVEKPLSFLKHSWVNKMPKRHSH